jgi:hypothetical protein
MRKIDFWHVDTVEYYMQNGQLTTMQYYNIIYALIYNERYNDAKEVYALAYPTGDIVELLTGKNKQKQEQLKVYMHPVKQIKKEIAGINKHIKKLQELA